MVQTTSTATAYSTATLTETESSTITGTAYTTSTATEVLSSTLTETISSTSTYTAIVSTTITERFTTSILATATYTPSTTTTVQAIATQTVCPCGGGIRPYEAGVYTHTTVCRTGVNSDCLCFKDALTGQGICGYNRAAKFEICTTHADCPGNKLCSMSLGVGNGRCVFFDGCMTGM